MDRGKYRPRDLPNYDDMQQLNLELENKDYRTDLFKGLQAYFEFTGKQYTHLRPVDDDLVPFVNFVPWDDDQVALAGLNSAWMRWIDPRLRRKI